MKRHCLTVDLKNDATLIAEYELHHEKIWPEIKQGIRNAGIESMEIYRVENRLFMVMEVNDDFSFEKSRLPTIPMLKCRNGRRLCGTTNRLYLLQSQEKNGC